MSKSQLGQDINVIKKIYPGKTGGYFVEVGAGDGVILSNTWLLEKHFGWHGICIEPLPDSFAQLQQNRNCHCSPDCAYSKDNQSFEFVVARYLSGIKSHIDYHKDILKNEIITVKTKTLTSILDSFNAPTFIEYLSIDTEGSELEVLKGIDFSKYTFGFINIEHNYQEPRRQQMRRYLTHNGYLYHGEREWDDEYIHKRAALF